MKITNVDQMRALDQRAIEHYRIPDNILMENAGGAVYTVIQGEFGVVGKRFAVFCGSGNNGGDGFVVARKLHSNGGLVKVFFLGEREKLKGAARFNLDIMDALPVEMEVLKNLDQALESISGCDAIVDALLGTGLMRNVGGKYRDVLLHINLSGKTVFSVDIPSGISGDTGQVMGCAVKADYTVTFGLPKLGNLLYPGFDYCGKLFVTHISFPPALYNDPEIKVETNDPVQIPERDPDSHKGDYGKTLFIAGSSNYLGAPYFSALSFLKAGGGLSYLASPRSITNFLATKGSEIVFVPQEETDTGSISLKAAESILDFSQGADLVVMGPGLSLNSETKELARELAKSIQKPLIIDGDGITAISEDTEILKKRTGPTLLTPHPGEMSRIIGKNADEIKQDRISVLSGACRELNSTIILKGAHTLIGFPGGPIFINTSGNPGMATAGSGDVLVGTIAAMCGMGLPLEQGIRMGVFVHGFSGDLSAREIGGDGVTAQDIMEYLPEALLECRINFQEIAEDAYHTISTV